MANKANSEYSKLPPLLLPSEEAIRMGSSHRPVCEISRSARCSPRERRGEMGKIGGRQQISSYAFRRACIDVGEKDSQAFDDLPSRNTSSQF